MYFVTDNINADLSVHSLNTSKQCNVYRHRDMQWKAAVQLWLLIYKAIKIKNEHLIIDPIYATFHMSIK